MRRTLLIFAAATVILIFATTSLFLLSPVARSQGQTPTAPAAPAVPAAAGETVLRVYVLSHGGKFIGDDVGGAQVTVRDAQSGELLGTGRTQGGSGVADLVTAPHDRLTSVPTEGAAVFTATMHIDAPRLVQVDAFGPLGAQDAAKRVSTTTWVLPDAVMSDGNRLVVEIPGLNVDVLNPPTHFMPQTKPPVPIPLRVNVTMMCGCPIAPQYPWKPENYDVKALIHKPDGTREIVELKFDANAPDHAPSQFIADYTATQSGIYDVTVMAHQRGEDNSGSDKITFIIP